jgi:hypothetical protein
MWDVRLPALTPMFEKLAGFCYMCTDVLEAYTASVFRIE